MAALRSSWLSNRWEAVAHLCLTKCFNIFAPNNRQVEWLRLENISQKENGRMGSYQRVLNVHVP